MIERDIEQLTKEITDLPKLIEEKKRQVELKLSKKTSKETNKKQLETKLGMELEKSSFDAYRVQVPQLKTRNENLMSAKEPIKVFIVDRFVFHDISESNFKKRMGMGNSSRRS